jgi:16S rRNA (cytosine967-C5)-methyltransferase
MQRIERVIKCTENARADDCLRKELASPAPLAPEEKREIASAVFSYHRWLGWLPQTDTVSGQVLFALGLAARFRADSDSFSDAELRERAVPAWVHAHAELSVETLRAFQR